MRVKNRSLKSISNWGLGRCRGKIKGYNKRIDDIVTTIKITNSLGQLTDDLLVSLVKIGTRLLIQKLKAEYRELELMNPKGDWNKDDKWFETARLYDMQLLTWRINNYTLYKRYRDILKNRK